MNGAETEGLRTVGSTLRTHRAQRAGWTAFASALLAADATFAVTAPLWDRLILAIVAALAFGALAARPEHGADAIGLRLVPAQGVKYWLRATIGLGVILFTLLFLTPTILRWCGVAFTPPTWVHDPERIRARVVAQAWLYPFHEEVIYRLVLCTVLAAWFRPAVTVIVGTAAFAGLHWLYGNPSPDNQLAGFVLVWAFLKSRSLIVPIVLHSLGNLCGIAVALLSR